MGSVVKTAASVVNTVTNPAVAAVKAVESVAPNISKTIDGLPVIGTVKQGISASNELWSSAAGGDLQGVKDNLVPTAKGGVVVGGAILGQGAGAFIGQKVSEGISSKGVDVGALGDVANAYLGNTLLENTGIDLKAFLPKAGSGSLNLQSGGSVSSYYRTPSNIYANDQIDNSGSALTWILAGAGVLVFILLMRR